MHRSQWRTATQHTLASHVRGEQHISPLHMLIADIQEAILSSGSFLYVAAWQGERIIVGGIFWVSSW